MGQRSWTKLADIHASIKVWVYLTTKDYKSALEDFGLATDQLFSFLKYRADLDKTERLIALRVLTKTKRSGGRYKPIKRVIAKG